LRGGSSGAFKVRSDSETREVLAHIIWAGIRNGPITALNTMAGGSVVPPFEPDILMPLGWLKGTRLFPPLIDISPPFTGDRAVVEEIGTQIFRRMTSLQETMIPNTQMPVVLGLTLQNYSFAFIGDFPVGLPYEGSIVVHVYNERFGTLAEKSFKVKIQSYNEISFG